MLLSAALLAAALVSPADSVRPAPPSDPAGAWATVLAYDEVRAEVDTAHLGGAGVVSAWVRWTFASRAVTPTAWDAGVRATLDAVEVDCATGASRTVASTGYGVGGGVVDGSVVENADAPWRRHAPGSLGALAAAAVCRLGAR